MLACPFPRCNPIQSTVIQIRLKALVLGLEVTRVQTNRPLFSTNAVHLKMSVTTEFETACESARLQDCNMRIYLQ